MSKTLFEAIKARKEIYQEDGEESKFNIPEFVQNNLKYPFFAWQKNALENFLIFERTPKFKDFPDIKNRPTHLLFHMATGAGKTMLMAAMILYYYQKGYRHFLFFVNQNNIVDKTENNFVDSSHAKFLFKDKILQDNNVVAIKKVETFSLNPNGIEIKFTSIQKLYNDIHIERENQTTLADLHQLDIIMLGDEAHHLNAQTRKVGQMTFDFETELKDSSSQEDIERKGWEHMVLELLLNKNGKSSKNVLLEFTATLPEDTAVQEKYKDKIVMQFALKEFLQQGYTKEINLVSSTFDKKDRILHAILFAWYRHKIALKYNIANFKSVMLFRSKTIEESKADFKEFLALAQNAKVKDFDFLKNISDKLNSSDNANEQGEMRTKQVLKFMQENNLDTSNLADWFKQNYQRHNVVITNSETNTAKTKEKTDSEIEKLLNSLEATNNPVRAIFTVDRLTEGWDVLNLFDIVRLYEGQNSGSTNKKSDKTASATVSEKQLIGRGVRYFPFVFNDKQPNKRKFDDDIQHELRILEELFYYTHDEQSRYITELKAELRKDGFLPENDDKVLATIKLKENFIKDKTFENVLIWVNKRIPNPNAKINNADTLKNTPQSVSFAVYSSAIVQETHFKVDFQKEYELHIGEQGSITKTILVSQIENHIFNKALHIKGKNTQSIFHFNRLQEKLGIQSRKDLQNDLIGNWKIEFLGLSKSYIISAEDKLQACIRILDKVEQTLQESDKPFIGDKKFDKKNLLDIFGTPKQKLVNKKDIKTDIAIQHNWYVMDNFIGNDLEADLIKFIADRIGNLEEKFDVHLIRNEEVMTLRNFDNGDGFMPDFILLLKNKTKIESKGLSNFLYYQILIEPKGEHLIERDAWKQDFLNSITDEYGKDKIIKHETPHYRLIGLPFFRDDKNGNNELFKSKFEEI